MKRNTHNQAAELGLAGAEGLEEGAEVERRPTESQAMEMGLVPAAGLPESACSVGLIHTCRLPRTEGQKESK